MNLRYSKLLNVEFWVSFVLVLFLICAFVYRTTWFTEHGQRDFVHVLYFCRIMMLGFLIYYLKRNFSIRFFLVSTIIIFTSYFIYITNHNFFLFDLFIIPLFITNFLSKKKFYNLFFYTYLSCTVLTFVLHFLGVLPHLEHYRTDSVRYALGFLHPNTLGLFCILISMLFFLKTSKLTLINSIFYLIIAFFCYFVPNSISATVVVFILFLLSIICNYIELEIYSAEFKKILFICICIIVLSIFLVVIFVGTTGVGEEIIKLLPGELWARFSMGNDAFQKYGLSLWGNQEVVHDIIVDSAYYYLIVVKGCIPAIIYVLLFLTAIKKCIYFNDTRLLFIQLLTLIYGFSENTICYPYVMFVFVSLSYSLLSNNKS